MGATGQNLLKPSAEQATFTTTGTTMLSSTLETVLPYYAVAYLEPGRYSVQVSSNSPVWVRVYESAQFTSWQNTNEHGSSKAGTNLGESDKVTSFNRNFDVGIGEEGNYYLLVLGSGTASFTTRDNTNFKVLK